MKNASDVVVEESYQADICFQALVLATWDIRSQKSTFRNGCPK